MQLTTHTHRHDATALTREAREVFERAGEQWTALRATVFDVVAAAHAPMSAYDIAEAVSSREGRRIAANTVYRILDLFVDHNLVNRIESRNAYLASAHPARQSDCIFLVCERCQDTLHIDEPSLSSMIRRAAEQVGFQARRPVIEVKGVCQRCRTLPA
jgi:Fur family zinc uptake transcriptional regulator